MPTLEQAIRKHRTILAEYNPFDMEDEHDAEWMWDDFIYDNFIEIFEEMYMNELIDEVEKIIDAEKSWSSFSFTINKTKLIEFIMKENIIIVSNFEEFIERFVEYYDLPTSSEYYDIPEYDYAYASYDSMEDVVNNHFEEMEEKMDSLHDADSLEDGGKKCAEVRAEFTQILNNF